MFNRSNQQPFDQYGEFIRLLAELVKREIEKPFISPTAKALSPDELTQTILTIFQDEFNGEVMLVHKNVIGLQLYGGSSFTIRIEKASPLDFPRFEF